MDGKFMKVKKLIIPFLTFIFLITQSSAAFANKLDVKSIISNLGSRDMVVEVVEQKDTLALSSGMSGIALVDIIKDFDDVKPSHWFYKDVMEARRLGIVNGIGGNKFAPNKNITYAEYITILTRVLGVDVTKYPKGSHWATPNMEAATALGIIKYGEIKDWNAGIPREDMAKFACRALNLTPTDGSSVIFSDTDYVDSEERGYINLAYNEYLIDGIGINDAGQRVFGYGKTVTRAQLATIALRIKEYKENPQMFKHERDSDRKMQEQKWKEEQEKNKGGNKGGGQVTEYITWNGYKIPKGSVFYEMNKEGVLESGLDFYGGVWFTQYPEQYEELHNILISKLDANTVKQAINYAKTNKKTVDDDIYKIFKTPQGYTIKVVSIYGDFTVTFEVKAPKK
ncbi:MAG TPA: S-layer homology domain-containing protein [Thermoanaerobacterales bacterium]|nr:S-layer homology domain-containing protein [Thermoanaerobacterales bacterium]